MLLVIGCGNPLRGDDGVGQAAARRLSEQVTREDVEIITCHQLTPELVEPISRAQFVVFIDACEGDIPGFVTSQIVQPMPLSGAFTHNVSPASLLASAQAWYGVSPSALLFTITGASFDYSDTLSAEVEAALFTLLEQLQYVLNRQVNQVYP